VLVQSCSSLSGIHAEYFKQPQNLINATVNLQILKIILLIETHVMHANAEPSIVNRILKTSRVILPNGNACKHRLRSTHGSEYIGILGSPHALLLNWSRVLGET